jgi:cytidylate kinase
VRQALFRRQRQFALQTGGAVLDGRDIGTVIAPEAEVKLFVVARVGARAARRHTEMRDAGRNVSLETITADLAERDLRDRNRKDAPLVAASDAITLDTSDLDRDQAVARAIAIVEQRMRS